jgi:hypothetical protein
MRRIHTEVVACGNHRESARQISVYDEPLSEGEIVLSCEPLDDVWRIRLPNCGDDFYVRSSGDPTVSEEEWGEVQGMEGVAA